jgi:uncharacterized protein YjbJ (UPF0337 family)
MMGLGDKVSNAGENVAEKVKQATGKVTHNRDLEAEGKADQASADVKQAGGKGQGRRQRLTELTGVKTRAHVHEPVSGSGTEPTRG